MSLILHVNSWVTIAEADNYLSDKFGASAWSLSAEKSQLLITAFYEINAEPTISISPTSTDQKVKNAQIEMAFWLMVYGADRDKRDALQTMGVVKAKADDTEEDYNGKCKLPGVVLGLLSDFTTAGLQIGRFKRKIKHYL
jgi:hypothetical protein